MSTPKRIHFMDVLIQEGIVSHPSSSKGSCLAPIGPVLHANGIVSVKKSVVRTTSPSSPPLEQRERTPVAVAVCNRVQARGESFPVTMVCALPAGMVTRRIFVARTCTASAA